MSLRLYPGAQYVANARYHFGVETGINVLYYVTNDSIREVQAYYEEFASSFVAEQQYYMTAWHPFGGNLVVDSMETGRCNYTQKYKCLDVRLLDISQSILDDLPQIAGVSSSNDATPFLSSPMTGKTLIIYSYYINDF